MNRMEKYRDLEQRLHKLGSLMVAFSGGVDSTFLLAVAQRVLGHHVTAVTVSTPYMADWEQEEAVQLASQLNVGHHMINHPVFEEIKDNPPNRCYLCKKNLFTSVLNFAREKGFHHVADGTNIDDYQDIRPGIRALRELGVVSPLADSQITKQDIREFSREMGLSTWDKPAYACLLSRLPFHTRITQDVLDRIEKAEELVRAAGFPAARVRTHHDIARIEVPPGQLEAFLKTASNQGLIKQIKELGYRYVTLDLEGYRMGSFNEPETNT